MHVMLGCMVCCHVCYVGMHAMLLCIICWDVCNVAMYVMVRSGGGRGGEHPGAKQPKTMTQHRRCWEKSKEPYKHILKHR